MTFDHKLAFILMYTFDNTLVFYLFIDMSFYFIYKMFFFYLNAFFSVNIFIKKKESLFKLLFDNLTLFYHKKIN